MQLIFNKATTKIFFLLTGNPNLFEVGTWISLDQDSFQVEKGESDTIVVYGDVSHHTYEFLVNSKHDILAVHYFKDEVDAIEKLPDILSTLDEQMVEWKLTHETA